MAKMRLIARPDADILVRLFLGPALLALAACSEVYVNPEEPEKPEKPKGPGVDNPVTIKGASAVLSAYMYPDRPARLALTDGASVSVGPEETGAAFR